MEEFIRRLIRRQAIKKCAGAALSIAACVPTPKSRLSMETARTLLERHSPCPVGTCFANNKVDIQYDLQIVIPVYNVEKYVAECLGSVLSQKTQYHVLVTVINDGSTDGSGDILRDYAKRDGNRCEIEFISQANRGFSEARNTGFKTIKGNYVMFLDSDDILPPGTVESMLTDSRKMDADILQGNWFKFPNTGPENCNVKECYVYQDGIDQDGSSAVSGFPWGKVYKYTVLEHFQFPAGFWFEDTPVTFILAGMPWRFCTTSQFVYGYRRNPAGISATARFNNKSIDTFWITERCLEEFPSFGLQYDTRALDYLLRQSVMNWSRIRKQPKNIREATFVLTSNLISHYFSGINLPQNPTLQQIWRALTEKHFRKFEFLALKWVIETYGN